MSDITLESLIQEHKETIGRLKYKPSPQGCIGFGYYYYEDSEAYQKWLATTKRFIGINYPNDKDVNEFETISKEKLGPEQQKRLLAIVEALAIIPASTPRQQIDSRRKDTEKGVNITITNTNSQSQNQEQSLAVQLFIEAIKDDLTGRQIKELKSVVAEADNDLQKARPGVLAKLKEFGTDVASNIVANLLTNPMIWGGL